MFLRRALSLWLAGFNVLPAAAQTTRQVVPVESFAAPVAPRAAALAPGRSLSAGLSLSVFSGPHLTAAPKPRVAPQVAVAVSPEALVEMPAFEAPAVEAQDLVSPAAPGSIKEAEPARRREAAVSRTVALEVAAWGPRRQAEDLSVRVREVVSRTTLAPALEAPRAQSSEVPPAKPAEPSRAKPMAARAALIAGGSLVALSAAAFAFPALMPVAAAAWKGPVLWAGMSLLSLSRYWRAPQTAPEAPRPPPEQKGVVGSLKEFWLEARYGADAQAPLEARVGGSSFRSVRNWFLGGLRAAAMAIPLSLGTMLAGWGLARPFAHLFRGEPAGAVSFHDLETLSLGGHMLGFVAQSLSAEAATLGVFDAARAGLKRLGAGRAAPWIAGVAALAVSAGLLMLVTTTPSVIGTMLGIEAAILWLRARSKSWLAPLALRAFFSLVSLEAARFGLAMLTPAAGVLVGLPAVWTGLAVTGLLAGWLAAKGLGRPSRIWSALKGQLRRVYDLGEAWRAPRPDGAPFSPWPLLKLGAFWGVVLYALGDVVYSAAHALFGGVEPTPAILVSMLRSPIDLVLYNFLLVGFLEEYVFRRGLFRSLANRLAKWGVAGKKGFWIAAVASGLIFSGVHYIDFGAVLAHMGLADSVAAAGLGSAYAFTVAGFLARAALGVALAWLYAASGTLFLPIIAHFAADSFEGLGLRWGLGPFLAIVAGALALQLLGKRRALEPPAAK